MSESLIIKSFPFKKKTVGIVISIDMADPSDDSLNIKLYVLKENIEFIDDNLIRIWEYSQKQYYHYDDRFVERRLSTAYKFPFSICFVRPWILPISSIRYIEELDFNPIWLRTKWVAMKECHKLVEEYEENKKSLWTKIKTLMEKKKS